MMPRHLLSTAAGGAVLLAVVVAVFWPWAAALLLVGAMAGAGGYHLACRRAVEPAVGSAAKPKCSDWACRDDDGHDHTEARW